MYLIVLLKQAHACACSAVGPAFESGSGAGDTFAVKAASPLACIPCPPGAFRQAVFAKGHQAACSVYDQPPKTIEYCKGGGTHTYTYTVCDDGVAVYKCNGKVRGLLVEGDSGVRAWGSPYCQADALTRGKCTRSAWLMMCIQVSPWFHQFGSTWLSSKRHTRLRSSSVPGKMLCQLPSPSFLASALTASVSCPSLC